MDLQGWALTPINRRDLMARHPNDSPAHPPIRLYCTCPTMQWKVQTLGILPKDSGRAKTSDTPIKCRSKLGGSTVSMPLLQSCCYYYYHCCCCCEVRTYRTIRQRTWINSLVSNAGNRYYTIYLGT